jgi:predicted ATP-dependent serine protease
VIGPAPLDELFGGGVFDGSVTMVVGVSGVGKTVLGMQLLLEGANNQKHGLMVSLDEHPYREFFHALVSHTKQRLMTTFLSYENPEILGVNQFMPEFPVSSIVDNIVLLNFVELSNTMHRALTPGAQRPY